MVKAASVTIGIRSMLMDLGLGHVEDLFDRMETNRKSRRSGTQEVKRRASNSGISPDGPRRTLTPRGVQSKRTLLKPL